MTDPCFAHVRLKEDNAATIPVLCCVSDPTTQAWLSSHCDRVFGFPPVVRFSWETATR